MKGVLEMLNQKIKKVKEIQETKTSYKRSRLYRTVFLLAYITGIIILTTNVVFAGDLFGNASQLLNDIYLKFVGMSTAAAGVGVGTGVFMKKLSLGKQDKIELGNKVVKDSLIGWTTLNALGIILNFASTYTK
jgi:hypothetical protein